MSENKEELFQAMVTAIRNEDNTDNLALIDVEINGKDTAAICWVDRTQESPIIKPLAVLITPEVFEDIVPKYKDA